MKPTIALLLTTIWLLWGCAAAGDRAIHDPGHDVSADQQTYGELKAALDRDGESIDYDTLMGIHRMIRQTQGPIPHLDDIVSRLIVQRSPDPRVDNIILIVAAVAIGDSKYPIDNAGKLFETILQQGPRLNTWVLSYVGDAIGRYPVDLPNGDRLADILERKVNALVTNPDPTEEHFGYHFLPPPEGDTLRLYLAHIKDQRTRVFERNCYYLLVGNGLSESRIEAAFKQLQDQQGEKNLAIKERPLKYLVEHWNDVFGPASPQRVPRPDGL